MSAAVYYEPNRLPAGILALLVHGIFFALLYFGLNWNRHAYLPATMSVQLWSSLPDEVVAPPVTPKVEEVVPPPQPEKIVQPDIVIPEKKKPVPIPVEVPKPKPEIKKPAPKAVKVAKPRPEKTKTAKPNLEAVRMAEQQAALQQAEQARQAEQAAAIGRMVDEYGAKIRAKVTHNVVMPLEGVADDAHGIFLVTLLPGGTVLKAELKKSSGNKAYDDAVERAILKSSPLPVPPDVSLFSKFREINFPFQPKE